MNEKVRVSFGIVLWGVILVAVLATGIYVFVRGDGIISQMTHAGAENVASGLPEAQPSEVGMDGDMLRYIDSAALRSIADGDTPGAVVGVVRHGKLVYAKSFGNRSSDSETEPITLDTRFDVASLTKPVVTAMAVMQLVERGEIGLGDRVERYIPGFKPWRNPEDRADIKHICVYDLLAHSSGIDAYVTAERVLKAYPDAEVVDEELLVRYIAEAERLREPRTESLYSCLNYILLGVIVERVSGLSLAEYAKQNIFEPLGMTYTCFVPDEEYAKLCAPTALDEDGDLLCGTVHDPLARNVMNGVSGNAGLFTTLDDMAIYAAMLLNDGEWNGCRILSQRGVATMFAQPRGLEDWDRAMCWAKVNGYSGLFGDLLSDATVGHSGATGTSLIIDRELDVAIIILTNRVNAKSGGSIRPLRSRVATAVAAAINAE